MTADASFTKNVLAFQDPSNFGASQRTAHMPVAEDTAREVERLRTGIYNNLIEEGLLESQIAGLEEKVKSLGNIRRQPEASLASPLI